ncbi:type II toxin-antitoxin system RelE/ParE family toxin [Erwinia sp. Leaf53]|uniref:type II toxin-antitoxin system RelE/ParE family toxin n=1 Tax=Erwinia sp. Leaf53 TaxID=1736225 RepID=UPI0009EBC24C
MPILLTPEFDRDRKRFFISDKKLCKAAELVRKGSHDGHLGRSVYKKRLGTAGTGARDGARSIIFLLKASIYIFSIFM